MDSGILETKAHPSREEESSGFAFAKLDRQCRRDAERSLASAALFYAAVYFVAFGTGWAVWMAANGLALPPPVSLAVAVGSILGSIAVGVVARRGGLPPLRFSVLAEAYGVLGSLGIAAGYRNWRQLIEAGTPVFGVSWIGIWIIAYPSLVTLAPAAVARIGVLSALMLPASFLLELPSHGFPVIRGRPAVQETVTSFADLMIPILVCTGIGVFHAARSFRLARAASRARSLGNYQLVELLGKGGMGEVWRAKHRLLARPAAVKLIRAGAAAGSPESSGATALRRFEREAQATAALTSPNTVAIYDFGINDDGVFYYVMELLEGMDLRTLVEKTGPVPSARAIRFLRQACASLADAHGAGLIHRDVKPANLFACRRGLDYDFVKVLDFGLVKGTSDGEGASQLTAEGVTSGTPAFMAPEMALGGRDVDARADLYALGCVGYWLLTGQLVFEGPSSVSILVQHAKEPPVRPSRRTEMAVDPELEQVVMDLLAKDPAERPASARRLDERLAAVERRLGPWSQERAEHWWRAHLPHLVPASAPSLAGAAAAPPTLR
ncbi:MAG: serine/threonine-protein kinase [bacterium]